MIATARKTRGIHRRGTRALQPAYNTVLQGTLYFVTDEFVIERAGLAGWESYSGAKDTPVTLAGTPDYITISGAGQVITRNAIDLTTDVSGILPAANVGAGGAVTQVQFNDAQIMAGDAGLTYNKTTDILSATGGYKERGYTVPMGEWTNVTFNAANFTATTGNWTVTLAGQFTFTYTLVGKSMIVVFSFQNTKVSATPDWLSVIIPGGFTTPIDGRIPCQAVSNNVTTMGGGFARVTGGAIYFYRDWAAAPWATDTTGLTHVLGTIIFPIN